MATTRSGSHPVVDFGISSIESLAYATGKLYNYVSRRKTASGFCQFVISDIKIRNVTGTSRHEQRVNAGTNRSIRITEFG